MFVLDTNVISELMCPRPDAAVTAWAALHATSDLFTTAVTETELHYGVESLPRGKEMGDRHPTLLGYAHGSLHMIWRLSPHDLMATTAS